jgi:hypothetical protein
MIAVRGRDANIYRWDSTAAAFQIIGCNASLSVDITENIIPCATADSGDYEDYISGVTDFTVDIENILTLSETTKTQAPDLVVDRKNQQQMKIEFIDSSSNAMVFEFFGLIQNIRLGAPTLGFATWTVSMKGCGAFTITNTIISPSPSTSDVEALYLFGDGTDTVQDNDLINVSEILQVLTAGQIFQPVTVGTPTDYTVLYTSSTGELTFKEDLANGQPTHILYKP